MCNTEYFLGDIAGLTKELIRLAGKKLARPFKINHSIDCDIGCVHTLGTCLPGNALQEYALGGLGRGETSKTRSATIGRRVAGAD